MSERRACTIIAADRSAVRYRAKRPDDDALRARLRELADQRRRFGYELAGGILVIRDIAPDSPVVEAFDLRQVG